MDRKPTMRPPRAALHFAAALLASTAFFSATAHASSLQISPVSLEIHPGQSAVAVMLRNTGDTPLYAQVRIFGWTQVAADDRLEPTTELVASPPIAEIAPHGTQMVRLVRVGHERVESERCFRLLIDELPEDAAPGAAAPAVNIRIRYSVPVFVQATTGAQTPDLEWSVRSSIAGTVLRAANRGDAHVRLSAVRVTMADGTDLTVASGLLGYALGHSAREWPLSHDLHLGAGTSVSVTATENNTLVTAPARDDSTFLDARVGAAPAPAH